MLVEKSATDALILMATTDPNSRLMLLASLMSNLAGTQRRQMALRAFAFSTGILLTALGLLVLTAMKSSMLALQVAGGLVLFAPPLSFGHPRPKVPGGVTPEQDIAVFPSGRVARKYGARPVSRHKQASEARRNALTMSVMPDEAEGGYPWFLHPHLATGRCCEAPA